MAEYVPLYTKLWGDKRFRSLTRDGKIVFIYLGWNNSVNLTGIYELDIDTAKIQTGLFIDFNKAFKEVLEKCAISYDEDSNLLFLKNKFKYQPKNSPKVVSGAIKELSLLPNGCQFKKEFIAEYKEFLFKSSPEGPNDIVSQVTNLKRLYPNDPYSIKRILLSKGFPEQQIVRYVR